jgi:hypothetical protein
MNGYHEPLFMKRLLILLVFVVGLGVLIFAAKARQGVKVVLAEQSGSGETGTALITQIDGKVIVTLKMNGQPADEPQPAHIHAGACPNPGAIAYPLTSPKNGISVTTLDTTLEELKAAGPLAINVHESVGNATVYVACGDIVFE